MSRNLFLSFLILLCWAPAHSQTTEPWKGFEKIHFRFQERDAWYIRPAIALEGNPWVWRAHFPDWHTDMDSILVSRGFHVAFINTNGMFAHPSAMQVWDDFYEYLTTEKKFASKVALEGVSRGGLYVYGWAKRNPGKVSCIYAEAPVCDPRSWPGGKGKAIGAPKDWDIWLNLFGLDEDGASRFTDIPLNDLEGLASFKVPVLHVIGPDDKVVPNNENTYPMIENYIRAGGPSTVYTLSRGEQKNNGHHFTIEYPELFADFITQHSYPVKTILPVDNYLDINQGFGSALRKFAGSKTGTVAFLGGSITHNPGWRTKTMQYLQERYPGTKFNFIAAGIPSLGSTPHAFRFSQDVLAHGLPDLLFLESAVNDRTNGFSEQAQIRALEGIIRQAKQANPSMDIVLMAFADPDKNGDWDKGLEPAEVSVHRQVARHYGLPFLNLAREVYDKIKAGEFSWTYDFRDLHPSPFGQEVYFEAIKNLLRKPANNKGLQTLPRLMDPQAYTRGHYVSVSAAQQLKGFNLNRNWKPSDGISTRPGFVDVPVLAGEQAGASFELEFTGSAIGIAVVSGPDAGVVSYSIDGKKTRQLDLSTQWSRQHHLPWYLMLDDQLKPGKHKLKLTLLSRDGKIPVAARIVHFLVSD